ncbi:unnamed protein product, partial [Closterium sp. NIES-65]
MSSSAEAPCEAAPWVVGVTARAPSNIAVIKYWGKRDEALVLPLNGSVSVTLHVDQLAAETTVAVSPSFTADRLWLNGKVRSVQVVPVHGKVRSVQVVPVHGKVRSRTGRTCSWQGGGDEQPPLQQLPGCPACTRLLHALAPARSRDHTAGRAGRGLAGGGGDRSGAVAAAAGARVFALAELMGVKEAYPGELSAIARMGSGSACRSLYGGFVTWDKGEVRQSWEMGMMRASLMPRVCASPLLSHRQLEDGSDSMARQVKAEDHWSDLVIIIAVVEEREHWQQQRGHETVCPDLQAAAVEGSTGSPFSRTPLLPSCTPPLPPPLLHLPHAQVEEREKDIGSSEGMKRSAQTSKLLQLRAEHVVPERITAMEAAIAARDFPSFARLT